MAPRYITQTRRHPAVAMAPAPTAQPRLHRRLSALALLAWSLAASAADEAKIEFQVIPLPPTLGLPDRHSDFVIRSTQSWYAWVDNLTQVVEPLPTIDFDRYTALVASAGYKAHGPVVVTFDSITDTANVIRVHVSVTSPPACPPEPESGHYAALALIPSTDKPIQFDISNLDRPCPGR